MSPLPGNTQVEVTIPSKPVPRIRWQQMFKTAIDSLRRAAHTAGKRLTIMADLPGPKIRIGQFAEDRLELKRDDAFTLTTNEIIGDRQRVFVNFPRLPEVIKKCDVLFLDGADCVMLSEESAIGKFPALTDKKEEWYPRGRRGRLPAC